MICPISDSEGLLATPDPPAWSNPLLPGASAANCPHLIEVTPPTRSSEHSGGGAPSMLGRVPRSPLVTTACGRSAHQAGGGRRHGRPVAVAARGRRGRERTPPRRRRRGDGGEVRAGTQYTVLSVKTGPLFPFNQGAQCPGLATPCEDRSVPSLRTEYSGPSPRVTLDFVAQARLLALALGVAVHL